MSGCSSPSASRHHFSYSCCSSNALAYSPLSICVLAVKVPRNAARQPARFRLAGRPVSCFVRSNASGPPACGPTFRFELPARHHPGPAWPRTLRKATRPVSPPCVPEAPGLGEIRRRRLVPRLLGVRHDCAAVCRLAAQILPEPEALLARRATVLHRSLRPGVERPHGLLVQPLAGGVGLRGGFHFLAEGGVLDGIVEQQLRTPELLGVVSRGDFQLLLSLERIEAGLAATVVQFGFVRGDVDDADAIPVNDELVLSLYLVAR